MEESSELPRLTAAPGAEFVSGIDTADEYSGADVFLSEAENMRATSR